MVEQAIFIIFIYTYVHIDQFSIYFCKQNIVNLFIQTIGTDIFLK